MGKGAAAKVKNADSLYELGKETNLLLILVSRKTLKIGQNPIVLELPSRPLWSVEILRTSLIPTV